MSEHVAENYQYWRDHGGRWAEEYARRKTWMVLYHIQELMLTEYVLRHAKENSGPLRVLEFGCGVGRHLRNLSKLANVDVRGFDQSESMARGMIGWSGEEWFAEHVRVGAPTGRLPYEDGEFDIVYSAEVLVHVRPEDLPGVLTEMTRVCRGHVFHLETSADYPVFGDVHSGCWKHDLVSSYGGLGRECEVLERGYMAHTPFRVTVGRAPVFVWEPAVLELYRAMERNIDRGFDVGDAALKQAQRETRDEQTRRAETESALAAALREVGELSAQATALSGRIEAALAQIGAGEAQLAALRAKLEGTESQLAARGEELAAARAELACSRDALESARREASLAALSAEAGINAWRERAITLEERLAAAEQRLDGAEAARAEFVRGIRAAIRP